MIRFSLLVASLFRAIYPGLPGALSRLGVFGILCLGVFSSGPARAADVTQINGSDINKLIVETMADKGMKADPRLGKSRKFRPCETALNVAPKFGGWKTVDVACGDKSGWILTVRTNLKSAPLITAQPRKKAKSDVSKSAGNSASKSSKNRKMMTVLALGRSMSRGDVITPDDVIQITVPDNSVSGMFFSPEDVIGRKLKTRITARKAVQARHLHPNWMVEENDEVIIQNNVGSISIAMVGLALENGQYGEWIKVQNLSSGIVVVGQIKNKKIISTNAKISPQRVVN